jgi:rubrerythrin
VSEVGPTGGATRRSLLQGSAAGAGAALLAGCGSGHRGAFPKNPAARAGDVRLLNDALAIEQRAIALYTAGGPLLSGLTQKAAGQLLAQDLQHAGELRKLLKHAGAKPHGPEAHYDFGEPRDERQLLGLLHEAERQQIAAYLHAIRRMSSAELRQALASIMASDAQHVVLLRSAQGSHGLPGPFLTANE